MSNPTRIKKRRASGFSEVEVRSLLDEIEKIKPSGLEEWMSTASSHAQKWPNKGRTVDSLRRKFQQLYRRKIQAGNPNCPPSVRRAKHLRQAILDKANCSQAGDSDDVEADDGDDSIKTPNDNIGEEQDGAGNQLGAKVVIENMPETMPGPSQRTTSSGGQPVVAVAGRPSSSTKSHQSSSSSKKKKKTSSSIIGRKRRSSISSDDEDWFSMKDFFKMMLMERAADRREEKARREQEREEEKARREEERDQRNQQNMLMMTMLSAAFGAKIDHKAFQGGSGSRKKHKKDKESEKNNDNESDRDSTSS